MGTILQNIRRFFVGAIKIAQKLGHGNRNRLVVFYVVS
jgi:hypothetical protein